MVIIQKEQIVDIPVLHLARDSLFAQMLPLVIFQHGFGSAKEHNLHYAYLLAEEGFRVILPDADLHGERSQNVSEQKRNFSFWNIVMSGIDELEQLKTALIKKGVVDSARIGMAGTSMGGVMTLGGLCRYPWICTAVSLMGNPYFERFAHLLIDRYVEEGVPAPLSAQERDEIISALVDYDLSKHPERLEGRPLLFWHGEADPVVLYHDAHQFYKNIQLQYRGVEEKLAFISDPSAGHKVTRSGVKATVEWFKKQL